MTRARALIALLAATIVAGCGTGGIELAEDDPNYEGAQLFAERCSGCHTIAAAGSEGTANRSQRTQGPDFNQRKESYEDALYAIRNGGFSGAIMPQNIVVGDEAEKVARFLEEHSGSEVADPPRPDEPSQ